MRPSRNRASARPTRRPALRRPRRGLRRPPSASPTLEFRPRALVFAEESSRAFPGRSAGTPGQVLGRAREGPGGARGARLFMGLGAAPRGAEDFGVYPGTSSTCFSGGRRPPCRSPRPLFCWRSDPFAHSMRPPRGPRIEQYTDCPESHATDRFSAPQARRSRQGRCRGRACGPGALEALLAAVGPPLGNERQKSLVGHC